MINQTQYVMPAGGDRLYYGNYLVKKLIGFFLIVVGVIMLICFMPYWMWLAFLGLVLIGVGCYVLIRKC